MSLHTGMIMWRILFRYVVERVVGGVGAIPQLVLLNVSDDLFPGTGQERAQNTLFDRTNTSETLDAGSATYINKESLGEIVGMVSHDDVVHFFFWRISSNQS